MNRRRYLVWVYRQGEPKWPVYMWQVTCRGKADKVIRREVQREMRQDVQRVYRTVRETLRFKWEEIPG